MYRVRVANRFGRCFANKKERFYLEQLQPGDHIVEEKHFTYWHHMIVEKVDIIQKQICVIHYYDKRGSSGSGSSVCRTLLEYTPDKFYRVVYEDNECLPAPEVLQKAKARIGENQHTYNPLTNNCEHFANECKTGKRKCYQIWTPIEILGKKSISTVVSFTVETLIFRSILYYIKKNYYREILDDIFYEFSLPADTKVERAVALLIVCYLLVRFHQPVAKLVAVNIETYLLYRDYSDTKERFNKGKLTREEACTVVVKRVGAAVGSIFGQRIGLYLGTFYNGWVILRGLGLIVGGAVGQYLGKEVGAFLMEPLAPFFIEYFI